MQLPKLSFSLSRGELIVGGLLESLGINDNNIIYGILNFIHSPSKLWYEVNKYYEDTFMRIAGFVCNHPCSILYYKGEHTGFSRLFIEIYLCDGEQVQ